MKTQEKRYTGRKEGSTGVKQELQGAKLDEVGFIQKIKNRAILSGRFWWVFTRTLGQGPEKPIFMQTTYQALEMCQQIRKKCMK